MNKPPRTAELANLAKTAGWPSEDFDQAVLDAAGRFLQNVNIVGASDDLTKWLGEVAQSLRWMAAEGTFVSPEPGGSA